MVVVDVYIGLEIDYYLQRYDHMLIELLCNLARFGKVSQPGDCTTRVVRQDFTNVPAMEPVWITTFPQITTIFPF